MNLLSWLHFIHSATLIKIANTGELLAVLNRVSNNIMSDRGAGHPTKKCNSCGVSRPPFKGLLTMLLVGAIDLTELLDLFKKASQEQAGCLFHNKYGRGLLKIVLDTAHRYKYDLISSVTLN